MAGPGRGPLGLPLLPIRRPGANGSRGGRNNNGVGVLAAAAPAIAAAAWAWAVKKASSAPKLWVGDGALKDHVLPWCTALINPYVPAPLALNTHAQNVLGFVRGASITPNYTRQLIIAHDGGTLGLDWFNVCDAPRYGAPNTPVLLVLHGINGGSHEGYCKWVCAEACKRGWRATVLNYRGCGGLPLTSPRGYAASLTHDIHFAITSIKGRFPQAPVFAVGFSLGGLFLTKYLAEADNGLHASLAASRQPATSHPPPPPPQPPTSNAAPATWAPLPGPSPPHPDAASASASASPLPTTAQHYQHHQHQQHGPAADGQGHPTASSALGAGQGDGHGGGGGGGGGGGDPAESLTEPWFQRGSGLVAAAVVSSPVCLTNSSAQLNIPFTVNYLYSLAVAYKLRAFMREHEQEIRGKHTQFNMEAALSSWTLPDIEDLGGIPKTFGFKNRADYYEAVSSLGYIPQIKTATLFLVAEDDPFLGVLPDQECVRNPNTLLAATQRGGHVAFLQGLWPFGPAYMDHAVLQFLDAAWKHLPPPLTARPTHPHNANPHHPHQQHHIPVHTLGPFNSPSSSSSSSFASFPSTSSHYPAPGQGVATFQGAFQHAPAAALPPATHPLHPRQHWPSAPAPQQRHQHHHQPDDEVGANGAPRVWLQPEVLALAYPPDVTIAGSCLGEEGSSGAASAVLWGAAEEQVDSHPDTSAATATVTASEGDGGVSSDGCGQKGASAAAAAEADARGALVPAPLPVQQEQQLMALEDEVAGSSASGAVGHGSAAPAAEEDEEGPAAAAEALPASQAAEGGEDAASHVSEEEEVARPRHEQLHREHVHGTHHQLVARSRL